MMYNAIKGVPKSKNKRAVLSRKVKLEASQFILEKDQVDFEFIINGKPPGFAGETRSV